jgi:MIP family channel proteins
VYTRPQKLLAEFSGTLAVVLLSAGAICAGEFLPMRNRTPLGPLGIALAYGLSYSLAVAALGRFSGGHFNPAVTIGHWVTHRFNTFDTLTYWFAQLAGASVAAYLLRLTLPEAIWRAAALGTPSVAPDFTRLPALFTEGLMTFALVLVLFAMTADKPNPRYWLAGLAAGIVIVASALLGGSLTGAAMNPARAFGPALASRYWAYQGVYWVGPLAGGVAAASLHDLLFRRNQAVRSY